MREATFAALEPLPLPIVELIGSKKVQIFGGQQVVFHFARRTARNLREPLHLGI